MRSQGLPTLESVFCILARRATPTNVSLLSALAELGVEAALLPPEAAARCTRPGDTALARIDVLETLDGIEPGLWELGRLARRGLRVLNRPSALLATHDKLVTAIRLASGGVPHPKTAHVGGIEPLLELEPPVVVKPRFGSWGRDVILCKSRAQLARCLQKLVRRRWFRRHGALVQELVPPRGFDLRLLIARGEVVGAVKRVSAPGDWRTNVALGGLRRSVDPPADACALASAAAAAVEADFVGVDLLPRPSGGYVVLELNGAVDFTEAYGLRGLDPFEEAVRVLVGVDRHQRALSVAL